MPANKACDHALLADDNDNDLASALQRQVDPSDVSGPGPPSSFILDQGFTEVPKSIMEQKAWSVAWSRPWQFECNILNTEARALVWSVEHLVRSSRCIGKRLLCFSDNLPLVLSATKGKGKSHLLKKPLRKLAALCPATGSKVYTRWIPSEINVADGPSRATLQWKAKRFAKWWTEEAEDSDYPKEREGRTKFVKKVARQGRLGSATRPQLPGVKECQTGDPQRPSEQTSWLDEILVDYMEDLFDQGQGIDGFGCWPV